MDPSYARIAAERQRPPILIEVRPKHLSVERMYCCRIIDRVHLVLFAPKARICDAVSEASGAYSLSRPSSSYTIC